MIDHDAHRTYNQSCGRTPVQNSALTEGDMRLRDFLQPLESCLTRILRLDYQGWTVHFLRRVLPSLRIYPNGYIPFIARESSIKAPQIHAIFNR